MLFYIKHEEHGVLPVEAVTKTHLDAGWTKIDDIDAFLKAKKEASEKRIVESLRKKEDESIDLERKAIFEALSNKWANEKEEMTRNELFSLAKSLELKDAAVSSSKKDLIGMIEDYEASITN